MQSLKTILILLFFILARNSLFAQCISGDCYNGYGTKVGSSGNKYVGDWKEGKMSGQGTYYYADGAKYVGGFKEGKMNGQGTLYLKDGTIQSGVWENDELKDTDLKQSAATGKNKNKNSGAEYGKVIQMGSIYEMPVSINDVLHTFFILDSGGSEVSISPDVALTLIRSNTISDSDFLDGMSFNFADGSTAKSSRINLKKLEIGTFTLHDVVATISTSINEPILLGENILSQLGKIQIDYANHTLTIIK